MSSSEVAPLEAWGPLNEVDQARDDLMRGIFSDGVGVATIGGVSLVVDFT